jgi:c(7)-type cytochrome triheme protein
MAKSSSRIIPNEPDLLLWCSTIGYTAHAIHAELHLKAQKDFAIESKGTGTAAVVFSHKKHAVWNGCEVCHPEIFPIKKGAAKYTMHDLEKGKYCGVCHNKVAFPIVDCKRCHTGIKT